MSGKITADGLSEFSQELIELGKEQFPKKTKNFMQKAGNKMKAVARTEYRQDIGKGGKERYSKRAGNNKRVDLIGSLSRGRAYIYNGDEYQVRVKNSAPHAHLFEHGHVTKATNPNKEKFVKGRHSMGKAAKKFASEYPNMAEEFVDELLSEGLK